MPTQEIRYAIDQQRFEARTVGSSVSIVVYDVSSRMEEEHIFPTKHKVECAFREYERNKDNTDWLSWLSLFIGVMISILTSDTKNAFGASAKFWSAVLISISILAFIMLVKAAAKSYKVKSKLTFSYFYSGLKDRDNYGD